MRAPPRRVIVFVALWIALAAAVLLAPGCYGRNCEGKLETVGPNLKTSRMIGPDMWESNPPDGEWLPFPRQRYYVFDIKEFGGRSPALYFAYLSANPKGGVDSTLAGGNLGLINNVGPNRIDIRNDSCSDYFLRIVVTLPPNAPPIDGGIDLPDPDDAGTGEAGP